MGRRAKIEGGRFGRLTIIEFVETRQSNAYWRCACDCGGTAIVSTCHLRGGHTQSCGCLQAERTSKAKKTHGHSGNHTPTPTYRSWQMMKHRCEDTTAINYSRYGGRGISVCARWQKFENFLADMGERPRGMSLDRHPNNNGNYEPGNCRWATPSQQARNRRSSKLSPSAVLEIRAAMQPTATLAHRFGVTPDTIRNVQRHISWREECREF